MLKKPFKTPFKVPFKEVTQNAVANAGSVRNSSDSSSSISKSPDYECDAEDELRNVKVSPIPTRLQELQASQSSDSDLEFRSEDVPRQRKSYSTVVSSNLLIRFRRLANSVSR